MAQRNDSLLNMREIGVHKADQYASMTSLATVRSLGDCDCKMKNFAKLQNKFLENLSHF